MQYRHLVDFNDITVSQWNALYRLGTDIMRSPEEYSDSCKGKVLATLFYEPSTRTMLSFQTAMLKLGGSVIGFDSPANSSVAKGENLKDTITIVSTYADIIAMRNPREGAALAASLYSSCPVINAGDGGHFHPTQTLTDLMTITMEKGGLSGLTIGLCGDLKHGRTVHSLLRALTVLGKNTYYLVSTLNLKVPRYILEELQASGNTVYEIASLDECIGELDILYMTRIQKERFQSEDLYKKESGKYVLTPAKLLYAKKILLCCIRYLGWMKFLPKWILTAELYISDRQKTECIYVWLLFLQCLKTEDSDLIFSDSRKQTALCVVLIQYVSQIPKSICLL